MESYILEKENLLQILRQVPVNPVPTLPARSISGYCALQKGNIDFQFSPGGDHRSTLQEYVPDK